MQADVAVPPMVDRSEPLTRGIPDVVSSQIHRAPFRTHGLDFRPPWPWCLLEKLRLNHCFFLFFFSPRRAVSLSGVYNEQKAMHPDAARAEIPSLLYFLPPLPPPSCFVAYRILFSGSGNGVVLQSPLNLNPQSS